MKNLLIVSNNVLSVTNNNGKTILSFIDGLKDVSVYQLYTSGEQPRLQGYHFFRITDKDIIRGLLRPGLRGGPVESCGSESAEQAADDFTIRRAVGRNHYTLMARDMLWHKKWKSSPLLEWLDRVHPDAVFFVAGDTLFSYEIASFVQKRYSARLTVYVTDDYIMPRQREDMIGRFRRKQIIKAMKSILKQTACFYTVCEPMRKAYLKALGTDSEVAVNMTSDLKSDKYIKKETELVLTYAGSFYYGRADVLKKLARSLARYNEQHPEHQAKLMLYSNQEPELGMKKELCLPGASEYGGSLNPVQLKERLNTSDILVFAESFDPEQEEKVRYSLSTKVPEYMSTGRAILAIGPESVGSVSYLRDVAACVSSADQMDEVLFRLLEDPELREQLGSRSRGKYLRNHDRAVLQRQFVQHVFESGVNR